MERFVRLIVGGGLALVAGLWIVALLDPWSAAWLAGGVLAILGAGSVLAGIVSETIVWSS